MDELQESGSVIHFHETEGWFSTRAEDARGITLVSPVIFNLELIPERERVKLTGHLQTRVRLACSRCLQDFVSDLDETVEFHLLKYTPEDTPEEVDLRPQDLDTEFYDGVTIDVDLIVAEQIFLALPQKPLCHPECKGICPGCGADLNHESCRCEERERAFAFDALRSLKIEK